MQLPVAIIITVLTLSLLANGMFQAVYQVQGQRYGYRHLHNCITGFALGFLSALIAVNLFESEDNPSTYIHKRFAYTMACLAAGFSVMRHQLSKYASLAVRRLPILSFFQSKSKRRLVGHIRALKQHSLLYWFAFFSYAVFAFAITYMAVADTMTDNPVIKGDRDSVEILKTLIELKFGDTIFYTMLLAGLLAFILSGFAANSRQKKSSRNNIFMLGSAGGTIMG